MDKIKDIALKSCKDEYIDYYFYKMLSKSLLVSDKVKGILGIMAEEEYKHYLFWSKYINGYKPKISGFRIASMKLLAIIMGIIFVIKIAEKHEKQIIDSYKNIIHLLEDDKREELKSIIMEEENHEERLVSSLEEKRIKYLGFIVLGLSDALIEIAGIHAGTLGIYTDTFKAGLAGLIAGVAASIAMSSAAYNQAKQSERMGKPVIAAVYTGIAYILTALLLALPYFVIHDLIDALLISLAISIGILAYIALYAHVLYNRNFFRELGETSAIIFGATFALYIFGGIVREYLGIIP